MARVLSTGVFTSLLARRLLLSSSSSWLPSPSPQSFVLPPLGGGYCCCLYSVRATNYYDVLEIAPKAGQSQVKAAYYRLSKLYHPDVNNAPDAKKKFAEIAEAYEVLGNKRSRRLYDRGQSMDNKTSTGGQDMDLEQEYQSIIKNRAGSFTKKKKAPTMGKTDIYDFDEFYRQHYGDFVRFNRDRARSEKEFVKGFEDERELMKKRVIVYWLILASMFIGLLYANPHPSSEKSSSSSTKDDSKG